MGIGEDGLLVCAGDGDVVSVGFLQMEGKKRLPANEFVKGMPNIIGFRLGE
jgi:methionyl-tRNA formyltransferase